jgi:hypothetical protein
MFHEGNVTWKSKWIHLQSGGNALIFLLSKLLATSYCFHDISKFIARTLVCPQYFTFSHFK